MSESAWTLLMIMLAPIVFGVLLILGMLVRIVFLISQETKLTDRLKGEGHDRMLSVLQVC